MDGDERRARPYRFDHGVRGAVREVPSGGIRALAGGRDSPAGAIGVEDSDERLARLLDPLLADNFAVLGASERESLRTVARADGGCRAAGVCG